MAADGRLGLGRDAFPREALVARARAWQAQNPAAVLQVKADAAADTQAVLEVLETLRAGVPLFMPDIGQDPRTQDPAVLAAFLG